MNGFLIALGALPIIVTKVTDMIRNALDTKRPDGTSRFPKVTWNVVPFLVGVAITLVYQLDYHDLIQGLPPGLQHLTGVGGQIITGLGLGAVASGWHELFDSLSSFAKAKRAQAGIAP